MAPKPVGIRCEAKTKKGVRCRCRLRRLPGDHYRRYLERYVDGTLGGFCSIHLAMLACDKVVTDTRGISWRRVTHDSGTGLFLFKPVCEVTKE